MRTRHAFVLALLALSIGACGEVRTAPPPGPPPPPTPRWELLGQREVDFRADRDVIEVGRSEGRFQKIRVVVRGAPLELRDLKVVFADDSVFDPVSRDRVLREDSAYVFDLPGQRRVIKRITFLYRSVHRREGKATVLVYGEH